MGILKIKMSKRPYDLPPLLFLLYVPCLNEDTISLPRYPNKKYKYYLTSLSFSSHLTNIYVVIIPKSLHIYIIIGLLYPKRRSIGILKPIFQT